MAVKDVESLWQHCLSCLWQGSNRGTRGNGREVQWSCAASRRQLQRAGNKIGTARQWHKDW